MPNSKFIIYTSTSIDGYIARKGGELDWLYALPNPRQIDHGYEGFYSQISTVILGNATYQEVLGFDVDWPYGDCTTYVISRNEQLELPTPNTFLINTLDEAVLAKIRAAADRNIWVVGGGQIFTLLLNLRAIDEMILTVIPTLLGEGIPLFPGIPLETAFELISTSAFETGAVSLHYRKKGGS
jgi:dihydrofolate reductase